MNLQQRDSGFAYFAFDFLMLPFEAGIHALALLPSVWLVTSSASAGVIRVSLALVISWFLSALMFILIILLVKRLVGKITPGRYLLTSRRAIPWILTDRLVKITNRSPYRSLIIDNSFYRYLYLRGMGAHVHPTLLLGQRVILPEPYFLHIGCNVLIGDEAILSAHKVEHNVVTLEPIEIGDNVLIGARAIIMPGTRIGSNATIAAGAIVPRGAVVPDGETWAGPPAEKMSLFAAGSGTGGKKT